MSQGSRFCCYLADLFLGCQPDPSAYEPQSLAAQTRSRPSPTSLGGCRGRAPPPVFRPSTDREPSISRINRFTNGEIALISLGIQASILSKERVACTPANAGRKADCSFAVCVLPMATPHAEPRASQSP